MPAHLPRWALSGLSVVAAAGLAWLLAPWAGAESAYLLFTVAVMVSARYGGLWSGLAATLLGGALVQGVFVGSPGSPAQWLRLGVFLAVGASLRNARVQTRLISDLLDLSRIVAGTMRVEMQAVEPVSVIRAALETVRPVAESKGVTLTSNVDAEAGPVSGDPSRLQQVLWNLLTNSIKFTPKGGTVAVRVQAVDRQVEMTVEDSGPGIPPAFLPHVFERFRQAEGGAARGKGGLGLGLAIARNVVELHQGTITGAHLGPGPGAVSTVR